LAVPPVQDGMTFSAKCAPAATSQPWTVSDVRSRSDRPIFIVLCI
jgi:hypothetical protein